MAKLWLPAVTALVTAATVSATTAYADNITTLQDLQMKTDELIKVAQADMKAWQKPVVTASNEQAIATINDKSTAGAKPVKKSTTTKAKSTQSKTRPVRGTRSFPGMDWRKAKSAPKKTS